MCEHMNCMAFVPTDHALERSSLSMTQNKIPYPVGTSYILSYVLNVFRSHHVWLSGRLRSQRNIDSSKEIVLIQESL